MKGKYDRLYACNAQSCDKKYHSCFVGVHLDNNAMWTSQIDSKLSEEHFASIFRALRPTRPTPVSLLPRKRQHVRFGQYEQ
jgi:hypothetical protein